MLRAFKNPSKEYRPIPFWSWNDKLEIPELEEQIEKMSKVGLGGYFMHARSGIKTDYLGDEWFDCIRAGIKKGKQVGMDAWIYDEEGWPSGFAGGIVTATSPEYHAKFMTLEEHTFFEHIEWASMIAVYQLNEDGTYERVDKEGKKVVKKGKFLAVRKHINPHYIDVMNKDAIDVFLECTHDQYYEKFGEDFGRVMQGFFTDEPRFTCNRFGEIAWSDVLPGFFSKRFNYDILDVLPSLFCEIGDFKKVRYDFWCMANELFVQHYMKTIYDWCEAHNCKSTGHIMLEESIFSQMTSSGGVMPFYEYLHMPGIDWLRRRIDSPVVGKQVGSVACQLGKKKVITESFGLCGWNTSFEEFKWITEWQYVNGVNTLCQHLQAYSIKGSRKRDYPPSVYTQQTWWDEYKSFNDYVGRLGVVLSEGNQVADVLLLHPMRSGYISFDGTRTDSIRMLDDKFEEISELLSSLHISYHYGDETIIEKYGKIDGRQFVVGEMKYKTVILPCMYAIDRFTVALLNEFIQNGGTVISMGEFPSYTNGNASDLALLKSLTTTVNESDIRPLLIKQGLISLSISYNDQEVDNITYQLRETKYGRVLFLVNHSQEKTCHTLVTVYNQAATIKLLNAETGEIENISYTAGKDTSFNLTFEPMQSYLVLLTELEDKKVELPVVPVNNLKPDNNWNIEDMSLNALTLDTCTYRIDNGEVVGPVPVIKLMDILLNLQCQCKLELVFQFNIGMDLANNKEFYAVLEDPHLYNIVVNGKYIQYTDIGWWKDKAFKKVNIKQYIQQGHNEIKLETTFKQSQKVYDVLYGKKVYETEKNKLTYDMEIESIYLLGDFGVISNAPYKKIERSAMFTNGPFTIVDKPKHFVTNNFTKEGLLFFAGDIKLSQKLNIRKKANERIILNLGKQNSPMSKVYINGRFIKNILWAPYKVDITDYVEDEKNELIIHMYASNRNLLGPHHHINGECYNVGPDSFTGKWSWVERRSEADATEIFDRNKNYWTDQYCFVNFGFEE